MSKRVLPCWLAKLQGNTRDQSEKELWMRLINLTGTQVEALMTKANLSPNEIYHVKSIYRTYFMIT